MNKTVKTGDSHPKVDDIHLIIHLPDLLDQTTELPLFDSALPHDRASTSAQSCWVLESTQTPSWSWLLLYLKQSLHQHLEDGRWQIHHKVKGEVSSPLLLRASSSIWRDLCKVNDSMQSTAHCCYKLIQRERLLHPIQSANIFNQFK